MSTFAAELRQIDEWEREDDLRAAVAAPTVDALRELHLSFAMLAIALRRRAVAEGRPETEEDTT